MKAQKKSFQNSEHNEKTTIKKALERFYSFKGPFYGYALKWFISLGLLYFLSMF